MAIFGPVRGLAGAAAGRYRRWTSRSRSAALDAAVALAATGLEIGLIFNDEHTASPPTTALTVVLAVLAGGLLTLRRRMPLPVLVVTLGAAGALVAIRESPGGVPALVALFTVSERRDRRVSLATLVPVAVLLEALSIVSVPVTVAVWALGAYAQTRRRYVEGLRQRAADLERQREQLARLAVHEERTRIARETHDIVAHSVSVMLIGVRGARDVLRTRPEVAEQTLARVEATAEQSLAELRRILTLLRSTGHTTGHTADRAAESRPQPSLAELDELVSAYRATGLPVRLTVTGARRRLPDGVELSAFRIVQEALTNVLKHSRPTRVTVTLSYRESELDLQVADDGTVPPGRPARTGHGLVGMRERVALLGGELDAGPAPGGGFRVAARLPLGGGR
ncbi:MAG TPA: sensor histidine kinase [Mycobacteriales bacterium]|nr:sensor histidine kinase [Mycobacteriales bacterium]